MSMRTHTCGQLRRSHVGQEATLCGWVAVRRDHGGLVFIDLRDRYGVTQVVFNPQIEGGTHELSKELRSEYVVRVSGTVGGRPPGTANPGLPTGEIELAANHLEILNTSETPPFSVEGDAEVSEDLRLRYRYLDLRRSGLQKSLIARYHIAISARHYLDSQGFVEVETPMLTKSTPEGARDYLVPSRIFPGRFFALPQSPQLFKQLLMVSGFDRYFQLVKCFRDEDLRADRQPEHTQIDIEMSFIDEADIFELVEGLMAEIFRKVLGKELSRPFARLKYEDVLERFGTDKPDMRYELELADLTDLALTVGFKVFRDAAASGGRVKALNAKGGASLSLKQIDELTEFAKSAGARGLAWMKVESDGKLKSTITKFFEESVLQEIASRTGACPGDLVLFVADTPPVARQVGGALRLKLIELLKPPAKTDFALLWVVDFPLLEFSQEEGKLVAVHHPFTSPKSEDLSFLDQNPLAARAKAYDLVINGTEAGGGSIRIHSPELQKKMFHLLDIHEEEARIKFGFLLEAFQHGAPPHGGIALGLDRLTMLLLGLKSIRETIAFPKTQSSSCLLTAAPSHVSSRQLKELHIRIDEK